MAEFKTYQDMIEKTLDLVAITTQHLFLVKSCFNPELAELKSELDEIEKKIQKQLDKVNNDLGRPVKLDSNASNGYYFRISRKVAHT